LEEIIEAITLKRLGQTHARIIFYNQNGYYDAMRDMLVRSVANKFMASAHLDMIHFVSTQQDLIRLVNAESEAIIDINTAVVR